MAKKKKVIKNKKKPVKAKKSKQQKKALKKRLKTKAKLAEKPVQAMPTGRQAILPLPFPIVDPEKLLKKLMEKASERGFVTEAEILHALPNFEDDISALENVMTALEKRGIEIVDQEVASVWEQNKAPVVDDTKPAAKGAAPRRATRAKAARPAKTPAKKLSAKDKIVAAKNEIFLGEVEDYFAKIGVIALTLKSPIAVGNGLRVRGHTTDLKQKVDSMQIEHQAIQSAVKGDSVGIKVTDRCRKGDKVFRVL